MEQGVKNRKDVSEQETWDLTALFESTQAFEHALVDLKTETTNFVEHYEGKVAGVDTVVKALADYESIRIQTSWIGQYASLPTNVDIGDTEAAERLRFVSGTLADISAALSFFDSALVSLEESVLDEIVQAAPQYASFIRQVKKQKQAQLDPAAEKLLAQLGPVLNAPKDVFEQARSADMDFGTFTVNGREYELTFVLYEEYYMYHADTNVRRAAFDAFSAVLKKYEHVMATAYYTQLKKEKTLATLRGYDSVFDYLLASQEVDQDLYHRQIDMIMTEFAPVMQKYITHLKEVNGLETMTYADLKIDLDSEYASVVSIEKSKHLVEQSLQPLGAEYVDMIMQAYPERWIDFAANKGKRSGAFCSATHGKHPYILLSWTNQLDDVYTLMHELGHAGQGILSHANNSVLGARMSLYQIEAPSTFHELLLTDYLKKEATDPRAERSVLSKMISKTYFHNFVTHLLEAAYQREVYRLVDAGKGFDANTLSALKKDVLTQFWGEAVELTPGSERTWMRQIHYYMGLYPYTYSAGLTIATQAFLKMKQDGQSQVDAWLQFLALGGQKIPADATQVANIDITSDEPLKQTIAYLDTVVDRIVDLSTEVSS